MKTVAPILLAILLVLAAARLALAAGPFDMVSIPGGSFVMGDPLGDANEAPTDRIVAAFSLMRMEVSNAQFAAFVAQTDHLTDAEQSGSGFIWTSRWRRAAGATWRSPAGDGSTIAGLDDHPVVQISAHDAEAFCAHYGLRLPTEAEWEFAARGSDNRRYPWGNEAPGQAAENRLANFGTVACCAPDDTDGYMRTAPVGSYPGGASPFGLLDMAGNVWEWTASDFPGRPEHRVIRGGGWGNNPFCLRVSYRHGNPPDFALDMVGFRCAGP